MKKTILVMNDDGIHGPGLKPLVKELKKFAKVIVIIPDRERSGTSHSLTLNIPIRVHKIGIDTYIVDGTPADCARFGALKLANNKVDVIISGINSGPNFGNDVNYSGTVAGAREGCLLGFSSLSVSAAETTGGDFVAAAKATARLAKSIILNPLPAKIFLNVNIPKNTKGFKITRLGRRIYDEQIETRQDARGHEYYWLAGKPVSEAQEAGTDIAEAQRGYTSITPIKTDTTALEYLESFQDRIRSLK
jgi:5'-nucleotidase